MKPCFILIRGDFKEWWQAWNWAQFKFLDGGRCPREADAINRVPTSSPDKSGLDKQHRQFIASDVGAQFIAPALLSINVTLVTLVTLVTAL